MAKHSCLSKYFADDKDIQDILAQGKFTAIRLREYARKRGMFLSSQLDENELTEVLRGILCDLNQVTDLVSTLDTTERPPKLLPFKKEGTITDDQLTQCIETIKNNRNLQQKEKIELKKTSDENYTVEIYYEDTFYGKTRLLQKEPRVTKIHLRRRSNRIDLQVEDDEKAKEVARLIVTSISKDGEAEAKSIDLSEIKHPKQRTAFFIELIKGIYAHNLYDVTDVKVEYMPKNGSESDEDQDSEEPIPLKANKKDEIKSKLKSAALSGSGILVNTKFKDFINSDFYLCKVAWTVDHDLGNSHRLALSAEFSEPDLGKGFKYSILGKWERNEDGNLKKTRLRLTPLESKQYEEAVEQAAFEAYDLVTSPDYNETSETEPTE